MANNAILARWFVRYRGLASGIAQAGVPLGAAVYGPLAQLGVAGLGWRTTHVVFGFVVAASALPLVLLVLRDDPKELGLLPDGVSGPVNAAGGAGSRSPQTQDFTGPGLPRGYWPIFIANMLRGLTMYAILVHQVAYMVDVGFPRLTAASYFSASYFLAVPGGLAAGAISDRIGRTRTYAGIAALYAIGYISLLLVHSPSHLLLLVISVVTVGVANGGASPVLAAFLTDRLQGPRLGFLLGLQNIGFGAGATLGPYLAGLAFDWLGSYTLAFIQMALSMVVSSLIISGTVRRRPATGT